MKTTKDEIMMTALRLFAERGFDAVSTSQIAGELGITKGALYRHYENKQEIFDRIIERMFELDEERANEDHVPAGTIDEDVAVYQETELDDFVNFTINQLDFWTQDTFASLFRKMITIEQYRNEEMNRLYQDVITTGPVQYTADIFGQMIESGKLNATAKELGAWPLAVEYFAPLKLAIEMFDGGFDPDELRQSIENITRNFEKRYR